MNIIEHAKEQALLGNSLKKEEIIKLLEIPLGSELDKELRKAANEVAIQKTNGTGYIWSAVGADYAPCIMNCEFCSFGKKWGIIKKSVHYSQKEIINKVKNFVDQGAKYVVLRTTEFYSIQKLIKMVEKIKKDIKGDYEIVLNTGELDMTISNLIHESGVSGIYHACRIREGINTPFDPIDRENTMNNVYRSELKLISLVEPIGIEHTNEEIADNLLQILKHKAIISGAMARIPVPGTPLGKDEKISDSRLAQIIAVVRLSCGDIVKDVCVHPATVEALKSGANILVVETGAVPRDTNCENDSWHGLDMNKAHELLKEAGYKEENR